MKSANHHFRAILDIICYIHTTLVNQFFSVYPLEDFTTVAFKPSLRSLRFNMRSVTKIPLKRQELHLPAPGLRARSQRVKNRLLPLTFVRSSTRNQLTKLFNDSVHGASVHNEFTEHTNDQHFSKK